MATKIDIVNLALTNLGQNGITSLSVSNKTTRTVNLIWTPSLELTLTAFNWSFARKTAKLALIAKTDANGVQPIDGWEYLYGQPADCLKARKVHAQGDAYKDPPADFAEVQDPASGAKALASDVEEAYCEFTTKVEDTTRFDPQFVDALAAKLAEKMALPLTGDKQLVGAMNELYKQSLSEAARQSVRRSRDKKTSSSRIAKARA